MLRFSTYVLSVIFVAVLFGVVISPFFAYALPQKSAPADAVDNSIATKSTKSNAKKSNSLIKTDNLSVAPVPKAAQFAVQKLRWSKGFERSTYYYPYTHELILFAGANDVVQDTSRTYPIFTGLGGLSYVFPTLFDRTNRNISYRWEGGGEFSDGGQFQFWLARRHVYDPTYAFRPYYSYGIMHNLVPSQQLASFSNWNNYLVRLAIGMQDVITPPHSLQLEIVAAAGPKDIFLLATCGIAWGL